MANNEITVLLDLIDQAFDHHAWHGTNLRGAIRGLKIEQIVWRPAPGKNNIWELTIHAAYWKYIARRRMLNDAETHFPWNGSNFIARPSEDANDKAAWDADVQKLIAIHKSFRETVAAMKAKYLFENIPGRAETFLRTINGAAAHDLYHAGQIQLVKALYKKKA